MVARRSKPQTSRPAHSAGRERWLGSLTIAGEKGCLKWKSTGGATEQTYKHRARDALGLADLRLFGFDKPRCREASRPVGPFGPLASRAPSVFSRAAEIKTTACPAPLKNRGGGALALPN